MGNKEIYVLCDVNGNQEKRPLNYSNASGVNYLVFNHQVEDDKIVTTENFTDTIDRIKQGEFFVACLQDDSSTLFLQISQVSDDMMSFSTSGDDTCYELLWSKEGLIELHDFPYNNSRLIDISCTEDSSTGDVSTNVTASQLWDAANQGMLARIRFSNTFGSPTDIVPIECEESIVSGIKSYSFKFRAGSISTPYDSYYYANALSSDSTVVLQRTQQ